MTLTPLQWVALLYGGVTPPAGFVEFRFLKGGARAWMPWPAFEGHPEEFKLEDAPRGKNVYFGVALRTPDAPATEKGDKAHCHPTHLVWTEVDLKDHPELTGGQTAESLRECPAEELAGYKAELLSRILTECQRNNLPPRAITDSGHGLHVYWARRARSNAEDTETFNRALSAAFGGGTESTDISRILRLPGTFNLKNPKRPLPVEVLHQDPDAWVEREALEAVPAPQKAQERQQTAPRISPPTSPAQALTGTPQERYAQAALQREVDAVRATGEGGRNDQLNRSAFAVGTLIGAGVLDEHEAAQALAEAAEAVGLEQDEIRDTLRSGLDGGKQKPRDLSTVGQRKPPTAGRGTIGKSEGRGEVAQAIADDLPAKPTLAQFRDLVLADFMERGLIFRYHQIWRSWWEYQAGVYAEVPDEVMAQVIDLTLQRYGHTLKNNQISEIATKIAREAGIGSRAVDQGPWELNTRTGVLNLEDGHGQLYEHTPEYFSIIQSAAEYRPESVAHDWLAFLRQAVPSEQDRDLLQQFAGLCLTGDTSPQKALFLIGDGGTGKGTFTRVLGAVLGNLATSTAIENIKDGSFLVGTFVGKRMCVVSELPRSFDWLPFKRITGEDSISVDVKNKTPYSAKLDMKLIILSNVMPFLGEDTSNSSLMRRILPVAFNVRPAKADPHLEERLVHPDELPGVLNWMLEGLRRLRENAMRFPATDTSALAREIVEESNRVISFLRDECRYTPGVTVNSGELYEAYRKWSAKTGHGVLNTNNFAKQLQAAGRYFDRPMEKGRTKHERYFENVTLSTSPGGWEE